MSFSICRNYAAGRPWSYRVPVKTIAAIKVGSTEANTCTYETNLASLKSHAGAASGIAMASAALLSYVMF